MQTFLTFPIVLIGYVYPFVAAMRGNQIWRTIKISWLLLVLYSCFLCLPQISMVSARELRKGMTKAAFPDNELVFIFFGGWLMPLIAWSLGLILERHLFRRFFQHGDSTPIQDVEIH